MIFAGIDPGISGAIALLNPSTRWLEVHDMPTFEVMQNGKPRKRIHALRLIDLLECEGDEPIKHLAIEKVWGMKGDTASTAFSLGEAYGVQSSCVLIAKVPHTHVAPQTWQKEFGVSGGGKATKVAARNAAMQLMPEHEGLFSRVKDHNRIDAILLAIYAARKIGGAPI